MFVSLFAVWSQHSSSYQRDTIDTDSITLDRVTPFALSPTTISVVGLWWGWCVNPERIHLSPCPFGVWVNNSVQNQVAWAPPTYFTLLRDRRSRLVWLWCGLRSAVCRCRLCSLWPSTMASGIVPIYHGADVGEQRDLFNIRVHTIYITGHHEGHQGHAQTQHVLSLPHARLLHRCFPCGSYSDDTW